MTDALLGSGLSWAERALGRAVTSWSSLTGGRTSAMLALTDESGGRSVLRLMTEPPWRAHGPALVEREAAAQHALVGTGVPAPSSVAWTSDVGDGVAAHLMTRLDGSPVVAPDPLALRAMAEMLATIHDVRPATPFREFQSWAWEAKWEVPAWTARPAAWRRAFEVLDTPPPRHVPTFLHRDFSHRNLLWHGGTITGVVDWVETSTGPVWLDVAHASTNLAVAFGVEPAHQFLEAYTVLSSEPLDPYWLLMDVVGFLPPPGKQPMFGTPNELARLDAWLGEVLTLVMR